MINENIKHYFMVEQWIPPYIVEQIKSNDGWLHFVTAVQVPKEQEGSVIVGGCVNPTEYYINGELIHEYLSEFEEVESRLQTGL